MLLQTLDSEALIGFEIDQLKRNSLRVTSSLTNAAQLTPSRRASVCSYGSKAEKNDSLPWATYANTSIEF
jgi:hypothetical protein